MAQFYTYIYSCEDVPFYVGKGTGQRAYKHLSGNRDNSHLDRKIKKLRHEGVTPDIEVINASNEAAAFWLERCFIATFGRRDIKTGSLVNMTSGGDGPSGCIPSAATREKIRATLMGRKPTPESIAKMVAKTTGQKRSQETKSRISLALTGITRSLETRALMRAFRVGTTASSATKAKMSATRKGRTFSPEHKARMSEARKHWWGRRKAQGAIFGLTAAKDQNALAMSITTPRGT